MYIIGPGLANLLPSSVLLMCVCVLLCREEGRWIDDTNLSALRT